MKQEVCVLPVRCKGCNGVFDLWYDLQREQDREDLRTGFSERHEEKRFLNQSFCWQCRSVVSVELDVGEDDSGDELEISFTHE